ncbi:MAG: DUF805 domain-containing protein [Candidatus Acidiferrales bacterium]
MNGRIRGGTFLAWYLPTVLLGVVFKFTKSPWDSVVAVLYLVSIPVAILAAVRRSHDIGRSGWFALICFIPFAGWYLVFKEGTPGPNKFGSPPGTVEPESSVPLTCKVCERGTLVKKLVHRLSRPAVVVGYLLLIPSVIGLVISGLLLVHAAMSQSGNSSSSPSTFADSFNRSFRGTCWKSFNESFQKSAGTLPPPLVAEEYCECALSHYKETLSASKAADVCTQKVSEGALGPPDQATQNLYLEAKQAETPAQNTASDTLIPTIDPGVAVLSSVGFLIVGLVGWLLVMRKRVLQCSECSATVNAS